MPLYYVDKIAQDNGDYEVHKSGCEFMPEDKNRLYLGVFFHCSDAIQKAKESYPQSTGCYFCSRECRT